MFRTRTRALILVVALAVPILAAGNTGIVKKVHSGDLVQFGDTFVARLTGLKSPGRSEALGQETFGLILDSIRSPCRNKRLGSLMMAVTWPSICRASASGLSKGRVKTACGLPSQEMTGSPSSWMTPARSEP